MRLLIFTLVGFASCALGAAASGSETAAGPVSLPAPACAVLAAIDFSTILDAPTQIIESKTIESSDLGLAYCEVSGYVSTSVGFVLRLPSNNWNGKMIEVGCGANCGTTDDHAYAFNCDDPLRRGYACIVSDGGHKSTLTDGLWAYANVQAQIDHAYRAAHVTAIAGKAVVERYYSQAPRRSYFMGCSTGGRQALMEAQRFPWDFDGIVAGSPTPEVPEFHMGALWAERALTDGTGKPLLKREELELVHRAVVEKCDLNDGIKDGIIGDPRACSFDPGELLCGARRATACLTLAQVEGVRRMYGPVVTSRGKKIFSPMAMKGSERTWWGYTDGTSKLLEDEFRYSGFQPSPGPNWSSRDFNFDRDYQRLGLAAALYSAANPDLRKFKAAGGKLLIYTGWNDVAPLSQTDYYETVERTVGGRAATQEFFRLFVVPGMNHCNLGEGAFAIDYLAYLEAWVERGQSPNTLIGFHVRYEDLNLDPSNTRDRAEFLRRMTLPLDPRLSEFSRPVYPYPTLTKYRGRGDAKDAKSFGPDK